MKRIFYALLTLSVLALACNLSSALQYESQDDLELALTATSLALALQQPVLPSTQEVLAPAGTPNPTETTQPSATTCIPTVTATLEVNVRKGPDAVFERVGFLRVGESAKVAGRESSGNWWYIEWPSAAGGFAWVWTEAVTPRCIPTDLQVVASPSTPTPSTPKADIKIVDIVIQQVGYKPLLKVANDGPSDLQNANASLSCDVTFIDEEAGVGSESASMKSITITLAAGDETTIDPGLAGLTALDNTTISCTISPINYEDPNSGNNSYEETFDR